MFRFPACFYFRPRPVSQFSRSPASPRRPRILINSEREGVCVRRGSRVCAGGKRWASYTSRAGLGLKLSSHPLLPLFQGPISPATIRRRPSPKKHTATGNETIARDNRRRRWPFKILSLLLANRAPPILAPARCSGALWGPVAKYMSI